MPYWMDNLASAYGAPAKNEKGIGCQTVNSKRMERGDSNHTADGGQSEVRTESSGVPHGTVRQRVAEECRFSGSALVFLI